VRGRKQTLDSLVFSLMPSGLDNRDYDPVDPEFSNMQPAYELAYKAVFGDASVPDSITRHKTARVTVERACSQADCTLRLFLLSNMLAHRFANPDMRFYANMLLGEAAARRVGTYRELAVRLYGAFDAYALFKIADGNNPAISQHTFALLEERMLCSEIVAGSWVLGAKARGDDNAVTNMLATKELSLDIVWLAIEPAFQAARAAHLADPTAGTALQCRRRHDVIRTLALLKRNANVARAVFTARESAAAKALPTILGRLGFSTADFEMSYKLNSEPCVDDMMSFWLKLGAAVQHSWCVDYASGDARCARMSSAFLFPSFTKLRTK
jgi:hypothetical protein